MTAIGFTVPEPGYLQTARTVLIRPDSGSAPPFANAAQIPSKHAA